MLVVEYDPKKGMAVRDGEVNQVVAELFGDASGNVRAFATSNIFTALRLAVVARKFQGPVRFRFGSWEREVNEFGVLPMEGIPDGFCDCEIIMFEEILKAGSGLRAKRTKEKLQDEYDMLRENLARMAREHPDGNMPSQSHALLRILQVGSQLRAGGGEVATDYAGVRVGPWTVVDGHCATRCRLDNGKRVAFIEKTPRVCIFGAWLEGQKGPGGPDGSDPAKQLYGHYPPSREWCDMVLADQGAILQDSVEIEKAGI